MKSLSEEESTRLPDDLVSETAPRIVQGVDERAATGGRKGDAFREVTEEVFEAWPELGYRVLLTIGIPRQDVLARAAEFGYHVV